MTDKTARKASRIPVAKTYKIYIGGQFPRTESGRYYPLDVGKGTVIYSVNCNPMFTVVEDSCGFHDTIGGCCSSALNRRS